MLPGQAVIAARGLSTVNCRSMGFIRADAMPLPSWVRWWLILVLLTGFGLRLQALNYQDIWWDEARNIDVALRPFPQVANAPELDIHPPLYFWVLHAWTRLDGLRMGLEPAVLAYGTRFLSVWAGVVGIALVYRLAALAAGPNAGGWAALLAACSPFWLAESQETRMYTMAFAWLTLAAVAFWLWQRGRPGARHWRIVFVAAGAAGLLTHYNVVFVLAAWYLWWFIVAMASADRREELRVWFVSGLVTALLVLPVAPIALRQIPGYANPNLVVPDVGDYLSRNWRAYWGGYAFDAAWASGRGAMWLWGSALVMIGGALFATWRERRQAALLSFLWAWLVGSLALYYLAVMDRGAFNVRYSSFVTPSLYILLGVGLAVWGRIWRPLPAAAALAALILWPQAIRADLYDERYGREDITGVTEWLAGHVRPNDLVLVDQKYPFGFYYQRYAMEPGETPQGIEAAPARYLFVDINTLDQRLSEWARDAERVYWVQWFESDTDPRRSLPFLLDQAGKRGGEQEFRGYSVDWWELTPPNEFLLARTFRPLTVHFPPAVQTIEYAGPEDSVQAGAPVPVVLRWQRIPGGEVTRPLKARLALYNTAGERMAQADERLLNDRHLMPAEWAEADRPLNVYLLETETEWPAGDYTLGLLVYDADTLEPLGATDGSGADVGVEVILDQITLSAAQP